MMASITVTTQRLHEALLEAFTIDELRQLVWYTFGCDLDVIAGGDNLGVRALNLVAWAVRQERIADLIREAHLQNPRNQKLAQLLHENEDSGSTQVEAASEILLVPIHYAHDGSLIGDRLEYTALMFEALDAAQNHKDVQIAPTFETETLLTGAIKRIEAEILTPERRITIVKVKQELLEFAKKRAAATFAFPFLFKPPLAYEFAHYDEYAIDATEGLGRLLCGFYSTKKTEQVGLSIWDRGRKICTEIVLEPDEVEWVERSLGVNIHFVVGDGWSLGELPPSAWHKKAIPAILMELYWLHQENPSAFRELDLNQELYFRVWHMGLA